ncbi:MAG TPA: hypothetical protein PLP19_09875 [bacterium]|nr:hypothetical protein [bacterium]HPN43785.1 hypothetical protein [bacterium]
MQDDSKNAGVTTSRIKFCDLKCEFADFPKQEHLDGSNSCRTFAALWCSQLQKLVTKNAPCAVEFGQRRPKSNL